MPSLAGRLVGYRSLSLPLFPALFLLPVTPPLGLVLPSLSLALLIRRSPQAIAGSPKQPAMHSPSPCRLYSSTSSVAPHQHSSPYFFVLRETPAGVGGR